MSVFNPDLTAARFIPPISYGPLTSRLLRGLTPRGVTPPDGISLEERTVPGADDAPPVSVRIFRPSVLSTTPYTVAPAMLWIHGGGHVIGSPEQDDRTNIAFARELGMTVVAVRYRLGAEAPAPASLDDAYSAFRWIVENAAALHVDPRRIAVGGASAGAGIAAALALLAHDRGGVQPVFQLLLYPMLDDRTVLRTDIDGRVLRAWTKKSNRYGWATYLGRVPGGADVSPYEAPARRENLTGLPPAWIGVGTLDLFYDEDLEFAHRLTAAGVSCHLTVVPGAFHGFDALFPGKPVSEEFLAEQVSELREAFATTT